MMRPERVTIKQMSLGIHKQGVYVLQGSNGEYYYTEREEIRSYKAASGAISFLERACAKYPGLGYIVILPSGKEKAIGSAKEYLLDDTKYGPHEWHKKNIMTQIERGGGSYDIYYCTFCGKEEKSYGLGGHSAKSGTCKDNPIKEEE